MNELIDAAICTLAIVAGMYLLCKGIDILNGCMPQKNQHPTNVDATKQRKLLDKCNKSLKDYEDARGIRKNKYKRYN